MNRCQAARPMDTNHIPAPMCVESRCPNLGEQGVVEG